MDVEVLTPSPHVSLKITLFGNNDYKCNQQLPSNGEGPSSNRTSILKNERTASQRQNTKMVRSQRLKFYSHKTRGVVIDWFIDWLIDSK